MTAMMIDDGKRVAAGGARLQWHVIPIADIDLIARNTPGKEMGSRHRFADVEGFEALKRFEAGRKKTLRRCRNPKGSFVLIIGVYTLITIGTGAGSAYEFASGLR